MKYKKLFITTLIFFLLVNTRYFWHEPLYLFSPLLLLALFITYIILAFSLVRNTVKAIKEKLSDKKRLYLIGLLSIVISLTYMYPYGIINFSRFESKRIFSAYNTSTANCPKTLSLKESNKFIIEDICFGIITRERGTYEIEQDSIVRFHYNNDNGYMQFEYGIISKYDDTSKYKGAIWMYENDNDKHPYPLYITIMDSKEVDYRKH